MTLFKFWLVSDGTTEESASTITRPSDSRVVSELSSNYGVPTFVYTSSVWYDFADSFGVYIDGRVYGQDLDQFQRGLSAYWNDTGTGCVVEFLVPELYFKANSYVGFCISVTALYRNF